MVALYTINTFGYLLPFSAQNFSDLIWVGTMLGIVPFIDNNFLMPCIVGNKVKTIYLLPLLGY